MAAHRPEAERTSGKDVLAVLCVIPFVQMSQSLYIYSCLPLHMLDKGFDLLNMGIFASLALLTRSLIPLVAVKFVALEKLMIPLFLLALCSGVLNLVFTDVAALLYLNIYCVMLTPARSIFQTAAVKVLPTERVRALRLYEAFYTIGYCSSSLWGAAMYTLGGWRLCISCQVAMHALVVLLACSVSILRPERCRRHRATGDGCSTSEPAAIVGDAQATDVGEIASSMPAENKREVVAGTHTPVGGEKRSQGAWWYLALFVCIGSGVAIFAYACEWSIYLVYLTERFDMSVLSIGVGQMSGDIGGSLILMLSTLTGKKVTCASAKKSAAACSCLCSLPWSMVWMGVLYALAYLSFLSQWVEIAVTGQVAMGTLYVLLQQGCSELVEWCSRSGQAAMDQEASQCSEGGSKLGSNYQSFAALADACFSTGCGLGSILPFVILEQLSAEWVCYMAAGLVAGYSGAFAVVFRFFVPGSGGPHS
eukprot:TRINITY_DN31774_c0_g1_i1.p1 TRINITY_DN31774_c0_g1~~TRINITY_DN31774_c0_g1_i1.p1  ORF type:complete len:478 (-),score=74.28 TRINITY_DN31774_c0_g1_i1:9-1442(-)